MDADDPVRVLDEQECWDRVAAAPFGRLAMSVFDDVDIVPVNAVLSRGALYFRTAPGSKLAELTANPRVAFEVDGFDDGSAFSVVVKGTAERLELQAEIDAAEELPLRPWIPTLKYRWVRIRPDSVSGRAFRRGPEPERY
jgi:nitroimidazol reductase NimA-like FMN-containing flavoprotein (pyridoxamine 5'-phosphate oxidase superfamily)